MGGGIVEYEHSRLPDIEATAEHLDAPGHESPVHCLARSLKGGLARGGNSRPQAHPGMASCGHKNGFFFSLLLCEPAVRHVAFQRHPALVGIIEREDAFFLQAYEPPDLPEPKPFDIGKAP